MLNTVNYLILPDEVTALVVATVDHYPEDWDDAVRKLRRRGFRPLFEHQASVASDDATETHVWHKRGAELQALSLADELGADLALLCELGPPERRSQPRKMARPRP